jgi:hypothetical protein
MVLESSDYGLTKYWLWREKLTVIVLENNGYGVTAGEEVCDEEHIQEELAHTHAHTHTHTHTHILHC